MSKFPVPQNFFYCPPLGEEERANFIAQGESSLIDLVRSSKLQDGMIKWTMDSDENGIQIFYGDDPHGSSDVTLLAGVTEVFANFDEIAALFRQETKEAYAEYTKLFAKDLIDSAHLYTISTATPERPRHYMGIRWIVLGSPYPLVANRDWCYLECQDDFEMNGRRGWGRSMTSISLPCCPDFNGHLGTIRATFVRSGFVVFESKRPGYLQVIHMLQTDFKGNVPKWVVKIGMKKRARTIGDFDKYLREKRLSAQPFLREHELVPKAARSKCFLCQSKFGAFSTKVRCRKCGEVVCGKCNKFWEVNTPKGRKMIRVCSACSISGGKMHERKEVTASIAASGVTPSEYSDDRSETSHQESMQQEETVSLSGSERQGADHHHNNYYPSQHPDRRQPPPRKGGYHGNGFIQRPPVPSQRQPQRGNNQHPQRGSLHRYDQHDDNAPRNQPPSHQSPQQQYSTNIPPLRLRKDGDETKSNDSGNQVPSTTNARSSPMQRVDSQVSHGSAGLPPPTNMQNARDTYIMEASDDSQFDSFMDPRGAPSHGLRHLDEDDVTHDHGEGTAEHHLPPHQEHDDDDDHHYMTRESEEDNDAMSAYSEYSHVGPPKIVYPPRNAAAQVPHRSPKPKEIQEIDPYAAKSFNPTGPPASLQNQRRGGPMPPPPGRHGGPRTPTHVADYNQQRWGPSGQPFQPQAPPSRSRDAAAPMPQRDAFPEGPAAPDQPRRGVDPRLRGHPIESSRGDVPNEYGAPRGMDPRGNYPYDPRAARDNYPMDPRDPRARGPRDYPVDPRDPRGRPYDPRDFAMDQRRDFPGADVPGDESSATDGETPRAPPMDPRYAPRDPRHYDPRDPYPRDPRGRPYDPRDFPIEQRRDFPSRDLPGDESSSNDGETPRAPPMDPRYIQRDPRHYPRDPRDFPRDPREYGRDPREYGREPRDYGRDPRDFPPSRDYPPQYDPREYNPRRYQDPRDDPRQFQQFHHRPPSANGARPPSVQYSADSVKDETSSLKSESVQDEVLRAMKALKGEETPDPQQLLALYKQLQQLNLEGSATSASSAQ